MKTQSKAFSIVLFIIGGLFLAFGINQIIFFVISQNTIISDAIAGGVQMDAVFEYMMNELIPQLCSDIILSIGLPLLIIVGGVLLSKLNKLINALCVTPQTPTNVEAYPTFEQAEKLTYSEDVPTPPEGIGFTDNNENESSSDQTNSTEE